MSATTSGSYSNTSAANGVNRNQGKLMSDFTNVSITFNAVIAISDLDKLSDLIFKETDWMGEPKTKLGCIVNMIPKSFKSMKSGETIRADPKLDPVLTVKAVRKEGSVVLLKKPEQIEAALKEKVGYTLILQHEKGLKFTSIEIMIGNVVGYMNSEGILTLAKVGEQ